MHNTKQQVLTAEQVKEEFRARGESFANWAAENGFSKGRVYRVLNGYEACTRGISHEIAVKLRLKADPEKGAESKVH